MLSARRCAKCFTHVRSFNPRACGVDAFVPFDVGGHLSIELVISCSGSHSQPGWKPSTAEGRLLEQTAGASQEWWSQEGCEDREMTLAGCCGRTLVRRDPAQTVARHMCRAIQNETPVRGAAWPDREMEGIRIQTGREGLEKADRNLNPEAGFLEGRMLKVWRVRSKLRHFHD